MKVLILTLEKTVYEGEALSVQVPVFSGAFQILENHTSIIVFLKDGDINLQLMNHYFSFCIKNGILKLKNNIVEIIIF